MSEMFVIAFFMSLTIVLYLFLRRLGERTRKKTLSDMPGPEGWPYIGNALDLDPGKGIHWKLTQWSQQYGSVYKIMVVGGQEIVVCNDYESIYEALIEKSTDFAGRPSFERISFILKEDIIMQDYGHVFKRNKNIGFKGIKQHGDGMTKIVEIAIREIERTVEVFARYHGRPFDPRESVQILMLRIIISLIIGTKMSQDNKDALLALDYMNKGAEEGLSGPWSLLLEMFPWTRFFGNPAYKALMESATKQTQQFEDWISRFKKNTKQQDLKEDCQNKCLLEWLLDAEADGTISTDAVHGIMSNILVAGVFTTYGTATGFLMILLNYPDIQKKLHCEIEHVIGHQRKPTLADRDKMPYMEACVLETLRYTSISYLGAPHSTICTTTLAGYNLPKKTQVWTNLYGLHHDDRYFAQPNVFDPTRFLDSNGYVLSVSERKGFLPFGGGKRVCLGQVLSKTRLFLFFTRLLQQFEFKPEKQDEIPSIAMEAFKATTATLVPPPFKIVAQKRNL